MEIIGHIFGFIAIALFFLSYQVFDKKKLLFIQTLATALICLQYLLIGAYSGFALNAVCIVRNILYYHRDKKILSGLWLPILFVFIMAGVSLFSWDGYHSLLIVLGLMINTVCMGVCNAQNLRKSVLITCPLVIIYNLFERSYSGIISESISFISAIIGIIRYKKACSEKAEE
ncbi:MAG: YgjV family protein [Eubacteriales bacterium]